MSTSRIPAIHPRSRRSLTLLLALCGVVCGVIPGAGCESEDASAVRKPTTTMPTTSKPEVSKPVTSKPDVKK